MLKITSLSLLWGLALLVVALAMLSPSPTATGNSTLRMNLTQVTGSVSESKAYIKNGVLHLPSPDSGVAHVPFKFGDAIKAVDFPYIHVSIVEPRSERDVYITWTRADEAGTKHRYKIENLQRDSLWLSSRELPGWRDEISEIGLLFTDMRGTDTYAVRDLSLHPSNPQTWFKALFDDWLAYESWDLVSINSYTGVTQASSFYRTPVSAALLMFSLLAYTALLYIKRKKVRFNWYPVGLIFLFCWVLMDMGWQQRLLLQLEDTKLQFSGLSSSEKLRQGPDAELVNFVEKANVHIPSNARVFVTSKEGYKGLRTAYHFYPHNVYWHRYAGLPPRVAYKSGDIIATVDAPHIKYREAMSALTFKGTQPIPVDVVMRHHVGNLYRVK